MSTAAAPVAERLDLTEFKIEIPCSITTYGKNVCDRTAEWWAEFAPHCDKDKRPFDLLLCSQHYMYIVRGGAAVCIECKSVAVFKDFLLRVERIKR